MLLYLITDRRGLGRDPVAFDLLVAMVADAVACGIDFVQIRERDLSARDQLRLVERVLEAAEGRQRTKVLVNDRFDVAIAAAADGVHLAAHSLPVSTVRRVAPALVIGASTHSLDDVRASHGADLVVFGPVFDTPSKRGLGRPVGVDALAAATRASSAPVLALGGIDLEGARLVAPRSAGIAGIRLFQEAWMAGGRPGLGRLADELRGVV